MRGTARAWTPKGSEDPESYETLFEYADDWEPFPACPPPGQTRAFVTSTTNALGHAASRRYYSCSSLTESVTDVNGHTTSFQYDLLDRLKQVDAPDGGEHLRFYSDLASDLSAQRNGNPVFRDAGVLPLRRKSFTLIEPGLDSVELTIADGLGRIRFQGQKNGSAGGQPRFDHVLAEYDGIGRKSSVSNPLSLAGASDIPDPALFSAKTLTFYDALNRVVEVRTPDGQSAFSSYQGNEITTTDQADLKRLTQSDALGRLVRVVEPDPDTGALASGYETRYLYDARSNLLEVLQGVQVRSFEYDSLGRLTRQTHPESGTTWHFYDDNSNPAFRMDERGKIREQVYDQLDRLTATRFYDITFRPDDTPWLDFFYDTAVNGVGRLASVDETRPSGEQTGESDYQYDAMGRVTRMDRRTLSHVFVSLYEYNFLGGITAATYPQVGNFVFEWTYDDQGRQTSVTGDGVTGASNYSFIHNGLSALETTDFPQSNRQERITYNERLQPVLRQVVNQGTGMDQMRLDYSFNRPGDQANNGNVWQIVDALDPDKSVSYDYDFLNRITEAKHDQALHQGGPSWSIGYEYDRYGNRLSALTALGTPPSFQDASTSADPQTNRLAGRKYDAAGNLAQDGSRTFQWDAENRLASVDGGATAEYLYDYQGRRVAKVTASETRFYDWHVAGEVFWETLLGSSQPDTSRAYLNGKLISESREGVGSHLIFSDRLGSPNVKTDLITGETFSADSFYPFGQRRGPSNPADQHSHAFTSKERDGESGLDYFGARYYGARLGRFLSKDPVPSSGESSDPSSWNRYSYAKNNPLAYIDPTGGQEIYVDIKRYEEAAQQINLIYDTSPIPEPFKSAFRLFLPQNGLDVVMMGFPFPEPMVAISGPGRFAGRLGSIFDEAPFPRGRAAEGGLGRGQGAFRAFPVIDDFQNGIATSTKSIDLIAPTYQNANRLASTLRGYVNSLADFEGATYGGIEIRSGQVTDRVLEIVIQQGKANADQLKVLADIYEYAASQGVTVKTIEVP